MENNELYLDEFKVLNRTVNDDEDISYVLEAINKPTNCPICGAKLHKHKSVIRKVRDIGYGHKVELFIKGNRYRCSNKDCGAIVGESYKSISDGSQFTNRFKEQIKKESVSYTFKEIADKLVISPSTVAELFKENTKFLNFYYQPKAPIVLGICEVNLKKNKYTVFVDATMGKVIEIKEDCNEKLVVDFINELDDKNKIEYVIMGFNYPCVQAIRKTIPNTIIVVDKYYVIEELLNGLKQKIKDICKEIKQEDGVTITRGYKSLMLKSADDLSPREYDKLNKLFEKYPCFKKTYDFKEAFVSIYNNATSLQEALDFLYELTDDWDTLSDGGYEDFINLVLNWQNEVFGYFTCPYKNIDVEGLNGAIKELDREGRGYSFETLRDKAVLKNFITRQKDEKGYEK